MALLVPSSPRYPTGENIFAGAGRHEATLYTKANWTAGVAERDMDQMTVAAATYRAIRDRIREQDPQIDEQTLADTTEGLTDLHEILTAVIRAALTDQALAAGLEGRIGEMQARRDRLQDRAVKRRQIAKDVMVELDLKKLAAPDFTASIRPGTPALMVIDEAAVPSIYWEPPEPHLTRHAFANTLKQGHQLPHL